MGTTQSLNKISFQDMKKCIAKKYTIITVMEIGETCLIESTVPINNEEAVIRKIYENDASIPIIIYGYNNCDDRVITKYVQLKELGFINVFVYLGGMFEWMLLQDIYGTSHFKTCGKDLNLLKYKPTNNKKIDIL